MARGEDLVLSGVGLLRKGVLAWIGAFVLVQDEIEAWGEHLVRRGEKAEAEGLRFVQEALSRRRSGPRPATSGAGRFGLMSRALRRLGRATREDTCALSARLEDLERKVASLK